MAQPHGHNTRLAARSAAQLQDENMRPKTTMLPAANPNSGRPKRTVLSDITNQAQQLVAARQQTTQCSQLLWAQPPLAATQLQHPPPKVAHVAQPPPPPPLLLLQPPLQEEGLDEELMDDVIDEESDLRGPSQEEDTMEIESAVVASSARLAQRDHVARLHIDIDAPANTTPYHVPEYCADIFANLKINEAKYLPPPHYLDGRNLDINPSMRSILVDWLIEVAQEYNLSLQTLFLAVNYTDRLLVTEPVARQKLQLVGVTAVFLAAKFFEVVPPTVEDFVFITDNTYSKSQVLTMEAVLLNKLQFNLTAVTCYDFLPRYLNAAQAEPIAKSLAHYISELTLQEYDLVGFRPSEIAACAVILALNTLQKPAWTPTLAYYTGYDTQQLAPCLRLMFDMYEASPRSNLSAVREKYSHSRHHRVSCINPSQTFPTLSF